MLWCGAGKYSGALGAASVLLALIAMQESTVGTASTCSDCGEEVQWSHRDNYML